LVATRRTDHLHGSPASDGAAEHSGVCAIIDSVTATGQR